MCDDEHCSWLYFFSLGKSSRVMCLNLQYTDLEIVLELEKMYVNIVYLFISNTDSITRKHICNSLCLSVWVFEKE